MAGSMPKERGWRRSRRSLPRKANDWKRNGQWNQPEPKAHNQQNKAKTPRTAGSYQMYLGHGPEESKEEVRRFMECRLGTAPLLGSLTMKTVPQPTRPEPDPGNVPRSRTSRQCSKARSFSGPPHPPKGKNLKS